MQRRWYDGRFRYAQVRPPLGCGRFTDEQAKTAAAALSDAFADSVATKADLEQAVERLTHMIQNQGAEVIHAIDTLRARIDRSIERLDAKIDRLEAKIDASELRVTVKMGAMMIVMVGIAALLKLLHRSQDSALQSSPSRASLRVGPDRAQRFSLDR